MALVRSVRERSADRQPPRVPTVDGLGRRMERSGADRLHLDGKTLVAPAHA
jgi:hypothetical protein